MERILCWCGWLTKPSDPNLGQIDALQLCSVTVYSPGAGGWARTWGGAGKDRGNSVSVGDGIYVAGGYDAMVDFDPGPGTDFHKPGGAFLCKYDEAGNLVWARTWGQDASTDEAYSVAANFIYVYVCGTFSGSVDFDPGPNEDIHQSNGGRDVFLSAYDWSGNYLWTRTWGGPGDDYGWSVTPNDGSDMSAYVAGSFQDTVDFDPGPGSDVHTSTSKESAFLSRIWYSGDYAWAETFGGTDQLDGPPERYAMTEDEGGMLYVTGHYDGTRDFGAGSTSELHTSNGGWDAFLSLFVNNGFHFIHSDLGRTRSGSGQLRLCGR